MRLFDWSDTPVSWTEHGYVLELGHAIPHRAGLLFQAELQAWLRQRCRVTIDRWVPAHTISNQRHSGELELRGRDLLDLDPAAFRAALTEMAGNCVRQAEQEQAADEAAIARWVSRVQDVT